MGTNDGLFEELRADALSRPGVAEELPWGQATWKVAGKGFVFWSGVGNSMMVKPNPDELDSLLEAPGVSKAPYLGGRGWISVDIDVAPADLARRLLADSYQNVVAKLPKGVRLELEGRP